MYLIRWRYCAPHFRVIFPHGGEGRWLLRGLPWGRLIYRRRFILLFARSYASILVRFLFPCCFSFICSSTCVSFIVSLAVSLCVSSHAFRCRCPSCRLIGSARFACRLVWAPFRSAVRSFSSRLLERDCLTFPCRLVSHCFPFVSRLARRLVVASRLPSRLAHLVSVMSSRSRRPWGVFVSVSMPIPVFAPFRPARRSFLFVHRSRFLCLRRGAGDASWGGRVLPFSSHPFHLVPTRYSLTRCGGCGEDGDTGHRFTLLAARSLLLMSLSFPPSHRFPSLSLCSHPITHETRKRRLMAKANRTRTKNKRDARARWIKQDARRDEAVAEMRRRTSKQMRCLDETGKRDEKRDGL